MNWLPETTGGGFVSSTQELVEVRTLPDCRLKPTSLVDQNSTAFVHAKIIFNSGASGLSFTVMAIEVALFAGTRSVSSAATVAALVNVPSTAGLVVSVRVALPPFVRTP